MYNAILANITWNPHDWKQIYINSNAGASFARHLPGHESLNFHFEKEGIDSEKYIFGYSEWTHNPKRFLFGGSIIFYSKNLDDQQTYIVGLYNNVEILNPKQEAYWPGFENDKFLANIRGDKNLSLLFPVRLN